MESIYLTILLAPLVAAVVVGIFGKKIGRLATHCIIIFGVGLACLLSLYVLNALILEGIYTTSVSIYKWMSVGSINIEIGFLIDRLTALMMSVVTFISLMVHIYTIGYMKDDPGYERFFCYISLFTFSMLILVMSNNFLQLFFGWEAVGVMSYLLIGFWYKRPTANFASMKAFLVNRVGDFGFLIGIASLVMFTGTLDYAETFAVAESLSERSINIIGAIEWPVISVACIALFIGAMGKSAQVPLHVWLPDSMEGPTPISALIHAATMVTAGVFMVARMSPLFEFSETALTFVLIIGATTALFTGLLGIVQNDIKRVIAYSTLSQLGYMTVALGASAYAAGIFHLMTHAFFKALLFLAAGSVIISLHHEQDIRKMGGLKKYLPITYFTSLIGTLALIGFPGTAGFFSKDALIEAISHSNLIGASYAYFCVLIGVFVTSLYSFRLLFLVFHGRERMKLESNDSIHESPFAISIPLILLAVPSLFLGWPTIGPLLFGDFFVEAIFVLPSHDVLSDLAFGYQTPTGFFLHGLMSPVLFLALAGIAVAWYLYLHNPALPEQISNRLSFFYSLLKNKYYFDEFNEQFLAKSTLSLGSIFWRRVDVETIDDFFVNGSASLIGRAAESLRNLQSGYLYHYAFVIVIGLCLMTGWLVWLY
ncbi:MAG: NADH-quinone oxidoreductase subunit L [Pseudomonadota bacterium]|nr:NADH-quinone oxidoreductase subunit L [Pseudomonadota bacterium]